MIAVDDLHKTLNGQAVLRGVSLRVARGELLALVGTSGGGKSVFLKHLVGLLRPDRGRVVVDGQEVPRLSAAALRRLRGRIGYLFQGGALFHSMTIFDNVAFPLREKTRLGRREVRQRVIEELELVGLGGQEQKYPAELSGGMLKRAALARALIQSPEILLFDEPTTGLDPVIARSIRALIASLHRRLAFTGVIVTHDVPDIFPLVRQVAMLHEGVVRFAGTPEEALASPDPVVVEFVHGGLPPERFRRGAGESHAGG